MSKIKAKTFEFFEIFSFPKLCCLKYIYIFSNFNLSTTNITGVNETTNLLGQVCGLCSVNRSQGGGGGGGADLIFITH
jgi:hypothetical protein